MTALWPSTGTAVTIRWQQKTLTVASADKLTFQAHREELFLLHVHSIAGAVELQHWRSGQYICATPQSVSLSSQHAAATRFSCLVRLDGRVRTLIPDWIMCMPHKTTSLSDARCGTGGCCMGWYWNSNSVQTGQVDACELRSNCNEHQMQEVDDNDQPHEAVAAGVCLQLADGHVLAALSGNTLAAVNAGHCPDHHRWFSFQDAALLRVPTAMLPVPIRLEGRGQHFVSAAQHVLTVSAPVACCSETLLLEFPLVAAGHNESSVTLNTALWSNSTQRIVSFDEYGRPALVPQHSCSGVEAIEARLALRKQQIKLYGRVFEHGNMQPAKKLQLHKKLQALTHVGNGRLQLSSSKRAESFTLRPAGQHPIALQCALTARMLGSKEDGAAFAVKAPAPTAQSSVQQLTMPVPPTCQWILDHRGDDVYSIVSVAHGLTDAHSRMLCVRDDGTVLVSDESRLPAEMSQFRVRLHSVPLPPAKLPTAELHAAFGSCAGGMLGLGFTFQTLRPVLGGHLYLSMAPNGTIAAVRRVPTRAELFVPVDHQAWCASDVHALAGGAQATHTLPPLPPQLTAGSRMHLLRGGAVSQQLLQWEQQLLGSCRHEQTGALDAVGLRRLGGSCLNLQGSCESLTSLADSDCNADWAAPRLALCALLPPQPKGFGVCSPATLRTQCLRLVAAALAGPSDTADGVAQRRHLQLYDRMAPAGQQVTLQLLRDLHIPHDLLQEVLDMVALLHEPAFSNKVHVLAATEEELAAQDFDPDDPSNPLNRQYHCESCKSLLLAMEPACNTKHYRYLEYARRRMYAQLRAEAFGPHQEGRGERGVRRPNLIVWLGLACAFLVGHVLKK